MQENVNIPDSTITSALTFRNLVLMNMQQLTNFPYIENDFDALTDYELLCLVVKFLNDVIDNQNEQNASITNMYNAFLALQTYVNNTKDTLEDAFNNLDDYVRNYFDNLDVQEEINNKLDQMLEDGILEQIIEQFIQSTALWCFDTVADMKDATNLISGSYARTLGYYELNDGGGATYKITDTESETDHQEDLDSGLKATLLNENEFINVKQYGAKGDNVSDDTQSFINVINRANETNKNIYIPNGMYNINDDIPTIYDGIQIIGEETLLKTENGTIINDYRENTTYLLNFEKLNNVSRLGGGIKNITFINKTDTGGKGCIKINNTTSGWTSIVENIRIANYVGTAITTNANDYRFVNCMIHHCSKRVNNTTYYAIVLEDTCNENKFIGCHFEHCRYVLKTEGGNFLNGFYECKTEMSTINIVDGDNEPPFLINSTNPNPTFIFNSCDFINMDIEAYLGGNTSTNYNSLPPLIKSTQGLLNIISNNFCCGQGSGSTTFTQNKQSKYIDIIFGNINDNIFYAPSYITPSVKINMAQLKGNFFYPLDGGTYEGVRPSIKAIVDNYYQTSTLGCDNRFFGNTNLSSFITPYRVNDNYVYRTGGENPKYSYNVPVKATFDSNVTNYVTLVIEPVYTGAELFAMLNVNVASYGRNRFRGNFKLNCVNTSSVHLLSKKDDSGLHKETGVGDIICCIKDNKIYVQVPVNGSSENVLLTVDGFKGQYYNSYVDTTINELITEYSYGTQVSI